jgi:hypothetical protein
MHQHAEQEVTGVAVAPPGARAEIERPGGCKSNELRFGIVLPIVEGGVGVLGDPRGMRQQVPHRDAVPHSGTLRQPAGDPVVQSEPTLLCEGDHSSGGKLLSQRARLIDRAVAGGYVKLEVGEPESPREHYAVTPQDADGHPWNVLAYQFGLDVCGDRVEWGTPLKTAECGQEQRESERAQRNTWVQIRDIRG